MAVYAIGDLQGCYDELQDLLNEINFDAGNDRLWFAGDLVNRGPKSLACLQFIIAHREQARTVLGNHDYHLLAVAAGIIKPRRRDTLDEILKHPHRDQYLAWIRQQPLMLSDEPPKFHLIHAGLLPQWSIAQAAELAAEAEALLQGPRHHQFIQNLYGDQPDEWSPSLRGYERARCIINSFTRMRYIDAAGKINLTEKGAPGTQAKQLIPWYKHPHRQTAGQKIIFGHWSSVHSGNDRDFNRYNVYPLDTACLWGGKLTALRLEDETHFSVPSRQANGARDSRRGH